jgi:D-alanine--D-alanine ligase
MRKPAEIREAFAPREALDRYNAFYLVGIGGAGMSGIARMLQRRGYSVRGSDSTASPTTAELETNGISVRIGHSGDGIRSEDAVVLSDAIDLETSPEVAKARELGCKLFRRSQVLGWLLREKKIIAVTGTHGKTTTTGLVAAGLRSAGLNPTVVVGAHVPEFGGATVDGHGEWAVVEACEAYDSFHDLDPQVVVLTNLELDHVDFHGSWENLKDSVARFISRLPADGLLIYCAEDAGAIEVAASFSGRKVAYTRGDAVQGLRLPGEHNALNAAAAVAIAEHLGADLSQGIREFAGAERRLQVLRETPFVVVDDYAHHPAEIRASLGALKERFPNQRLIVVYQPHLYSRTAGLITEFAEALSMADVVVLTDIYPAREAPMPGVSSARIAELVTKPADYVPSRHLLPRHVAKIARPGDVVVGMGAGNIAEFAPDLLRELDVHPPDFYTTGLARKKVAVIYGGDSAEREVSLHSGLAVKAALDRKGYDARLYDVAELLLARGDLSMFAGVGRPDVAFLAVHGTHAEDGATQGLFELLHIPYTGSNIQASAIAMDKRLTKQILGANGIRVPRGITLRSAAIDSKESLHKELLDRHLTTPLIVKPNAQGSTVGLSFVEREEQIWPALQKALRYDESALIEEWVQGVEISVPVLGNRALPPVEIAPVSGQYDFASKYLPGATEEIIPARLHPDQLREAEEIAVKAHAAIGCEGATRTDMIVRDQEIFVLEVNTLPGLTATSLLPNSAKSAGIDFDALIDWIVQDALRRHEAKT